MTRVEFRPNLKEVKTTNGKTRLILEIDKHLLKGCMEDLSMLEGGKITASFRPETISYSVPYDKTTNTPTLRYEQNTSGEWEVIREEQTNLMGEDDIEKRNFLVELDIVDEFIKTAILDYPGEINPDDVLERIETGESLDDIALDYEMIVEDLEAELDQARNYYAPYAAAWNEKRKRED